MNSRTNGERRGARIKNVAWVALTLALTALGPADAHAEDCYETGFGGVANLIRDTGKDCQVLNATPQTSYMLVDGSIDFIADPRWSNWKNTTIRRLRPGNPLDLELRSIVAPRYILFRTLTLRDVNLDPTNTELKFQQAENIALTLENASVNLARQPVWPADSSLTLEAVSGDNMIEKLSGNLASPTTLTVPDGTALKFLACGSTAPDQPDIARCNFQGFPSIVDIEGVLELDLSWVKFKTGTDAPMRVHNGGRTLLSTSDSVLETGYLEVDGGSLEMVSGSKTSVVSELTLSNASLLMEGASQVLAKAIETYGDSTCTLGSTPSGSRSRVIVDDLVLVNGGATLTLAGYGTVVTPGLLLVGSHVEVTESTSLVITGVSNQWDSIGSTIDIDPDAALLVDSGGEVSSSIPIHNDGTFRVEGTFRPSGEMSGDGVLQVNPGGTLGGLNRDPGDASATFAASPKILLDPFSSFKVGISPLAGTSQKLIARSSFAISTPFAYLKPVIPAGADKSLAPGTEFVIVEFPEGNEIGGYFARSDGTRLLDGDTFTLGLNVYRINYNATNVTLTVVDISSGHAHDDFYTTMQDQLLDVPAPGVLGNDVGVTGAPTVVDGPTHGTVSLNSNGSFTYVPAAGFSGDDLFTYEVGTSNVATVYIHVWAQADCTLTAGYWQTHTGFGGARLDSTWLGLPQGAHTPFFLSQQSYYEVISSAVRGNVYYSLAQQYIAVELNFLRGADPADAQAAFDMATALLKTTTPEEASALKGQAKAEWVDLVQILDAYNQGDIGPGHCMD